MATVSILWGDGSADKITVSYTGTAGTSPMSVTSDPNRSVVTREKVLKLKNSAGTILATLTVRQSKRSRAYSVDYNVAYK